MFWGYSAHDNFGSIIKNKIENFDLQKCLILTGYNLEAGSATKQVVTYGN